MEAEPDPTDPSEVGPEVVMVLAFSCAVVVDDDEPDDQMVEVDLVVANRPVLAGRLVAVAAN